MKHVHLLTEGKISRKDYKNLIQEELLELELEGAELTRQSFDDYLIADTLARISEYEVEERIFLRKKLVDSAKKKRTLADHYTEALVALIDKNKSLLTYISGDQGLSSISFHRLKHDGVYVNFAYFNKDASNNTFFKFPQLDSNKKVLILLDGMYMDWSCWRWVVKLLKDEFQILAIDLNGYGESEAWDVPNTPETRHFLY